MVPRVLEYLFTSLGSAGSNAPANLTATCSFYEIYQERVYDLLQTENKNGESSLQVREDAKHGVFVDGITVEHVLSSQDASRILAFGYNNRHVGATTMNRESSRSHAVFLLTLEISEEQQNGAIRTTRRSRFFFKCYSNSIIYLLVCLLFSFSPFIHLNFSSFLISTSKSKLN